MRERVHAPVLLRLSARVLLRERRSSTWSCLGSRRGWEVGTWSREREWKRRRSRLRDNCDNQAGKRGPEWNTIQDPGQVKQSAHEAEGRESEQDDDGPTPLRPLLREETRGRRASSSQASGSQEVPRQRGERGPACPPAIHLDALLPPAVVLLPLFAGWRGDSLGDCTRRVPRILLVSHGSTVLRARVDTGQGRLALVEEEDRPATATHSSSTRRDTRQRTALEG